MDPAEDDEDLSKLSSVPPPGMITGTCRNYISHEDLEPVDSDDVYEQILLMARAAFELSRVKRSFLESV